MMILSLRATAFVISLVTTSLHAFSVAPFSNNVVGKTYNQKKISHNSFRHSHILRATSEEQEKKDDEIERLKSMAAKLRAEVASLEADRQEELALAAQHAFEKFDTNKDGVISLEELKEGLERELKLELPEKRVKKVMEDFDTTGSGELQLDEFVSVEQFRNKLEALARDEKQAALDAAKAAQKEEAVAQVIQQQLDMINEKPPSASERVLSCLPYLFPLLDSLQFGRYLMLDNADNIFVAILAIVFALYRSIPFSGLICFFALSFLSGNLSINRLIRFNMQQSIFLDIALFFPGLFGALYGILFSNVLPLPQAVTVLGNDAVFFGLLLTIGYCTVSSLLGIAPDKIPLLSDAVSARMPTVDSFSNNLQDMGLMKMEEKKDDKKKDDKKDE